MKKLSDNYEEVKDQQESATIDENKIQLSLALDYSSKHYPSALLLIGKFAPEVLIVHGDFTTTLKPFYLDRFGCEDIDYKRGMPLFFNEERYDRMIDEILSGDFSFYFRS